MRGALLVLTVYVALLWLADGETSDAGTTRRTIVVFVYDRACCGAGMTRLAVAVALSAVGRAAVSRGGGC